MAFKTTTNTSNEYQSINEMFRDIRTKKIDALYVHQAEIIETYEKDHFESPDVALELPTGNGKTLIGLLIAEFKRRVHGQKTLFVCSTNQLVNQVVTLANEKYGIKATAFTGKQRQYSTQSKNDYITAQTVAVTNYSSLFNTNPFFENCDVIILDDAHVAENYIGGTWSLRIERDIQPYSDLLEILKSGLDYSEYVKFTKDDIDPFHKDDVQLIPSQIIYNLKDSIHSYLDANLSRDDEDTSSAYYTWQFLKDNLMACQAYISWREILIRPLIPPSRTIEPFANAKQRIYMSATLGAGGDLERITGIRKIERIPLPKGWDKQGTGRRFFVFGNAHLEDEDRENLIIEANKIFKRSLTLVPDYPRANEIQELIVTKLGWPTFNAKDIETSKLGFIQSEFGAVIVANRYEGIDFEGDECRLLFAVSLPKTINNQENFLASRMGSLIVLKDRIKTRMIQAIGRCTRGPSDYSCVIVIGDDITRRFLDSDFNRFFHPELQAEIKFGADQSRGIALPELLENIKIFKAQGDDWRHAETEIYAIRNRSVQIEIPGTDKLHDGVSAEVDFQYAMWNKDYDAAVGYATTVLQKLENGAQELKGYRGFWYYLASVASFLAFKEYNRPEYDEKARTHLREASRCAPTISWIRKLELNLEKKSDVNRDLSLASNVENVDTVFAKFGISNQSKFEKHLQEISDGLNHGDAKAFEAAQQKLGSILGYDSKKVYEDGSPDPYWITNGDTCIVFEDNTDKQNDTIHITKVRQAALHHKWIIDREKGVTPAFIHTVFLTSATKLDKEAFPFADNLLYWRLDEFRAWANKALQVLRNCRASYVPGNLDWREHVMDEFQKASLDPRSMIEVLKKNTVKELPIK